MFNVQCGVGREALGSSFFRRNSHSRETHLHIVTRTHRPSPGISSIIHSESSGFTVDASERRSMSGGWPLTPSVSAVGVSSKATSFALILGGIGAFTTTFSES